MNKDNSVHAKTNKQSFSLSKTCLITFKKSEAVTETAEEEKTGEEQQLTFDDFSANFKI